jgi:hypothetical protein
MHQTGHWRHTKRQSKLRYRAEADNSTEKAMACNVGKNCAAKPLTCQYEVAVLPVGQRTDASRLHLPNVPLFGLWWMRTTERSSQMISASSRRVSDHSDPCVNARIRNKTERSVAYHQSHPEEINQRLHELDKEWDVERMLETGSSTLTLSGLLLGITRNRKWLLLSLAVQGFFMQHALQGWCPPLPVLRRLGFRTQYEIEQERYALKAIRGDFKRVPVEPSEPNQAKEILDAAAR